MSKWISADYLLGRMSLRRDGVLTKHDIETAPYAEFKWIPVTERLPEIGDSCLVVVKYKYDFEKEYTYDTDVAIYCSADGYIDGCWDTYNDWNEGQQYIHVTHWMPLPEPPMEE